MSLPELLHLDEVSEDGPFPPSHSLTAYWNVDTAGVEPATTKLMAALLGVREAVEAVYREEAVGPPPVSKVNWANDPHAARQDYLDPAPTGIDAKWVWDQLQLDGAGVALVDVEMGWNLDHEDLKGKTPTRLNPADWNNPAEEDHGTAALGVVVGEDNSVGIVGIAPGVTTVRVASHWNGTVSTKVADAIALAATNLASGDVLLLETQTSVYGPTETTTGGLELNAIKAATNSGIIVIEPAGNAGRNLDTWFTGGWSGIWASGAIMVGASVGDPPAYGNIAHAPASDSNVSMRIDCFAPGVELVSAGGGDLADSGPNKTYTKDFGETSGASAIIAGAAILVQHMHVAASGTRLGPVEMRSLLSDSANGTPQGAAGPDNNIGVMPNLRRIAASLVDLYVRDYVGDSGVEPSTGPLSSSPDVFVLPAPIADAQVKFGEGSGKENSETLSEPILINADHQVYVRVRNRGSCPINGVTATVYWSEVSTLVTPSSWNKIGTSAGFTVQPGDLLTVAPPITWFAAQIPAPGHYCFVAQVTSSYDQAPAAPSPTDWNGFLTYLRQSNNVTWRNFNVLDPNALQSGAWFWMNGAPDQARRFDFEIHRRLPAGVRLSLEIPLALLGAVRGPYVKEHRRDRDEEVVRIALSAEPLIRLPAIRLGPDAHYRCRFVLSPDAARYPDEPVMGSVAIRQLFEGQEVGRITWVLRPRRREG